MASCPIPSGWAPWSVCRSLLLQNLDWPDYGCQWRSSLLCLNLKLSALKIWWKDGYFGFRLKYVRSHFILESGIKQWWNHNFGLVLKVRGCKMLRALISLALPVTLEDPHIYQSKDGYFRRGPRVRGNAQYALSMGLLTFHAKERIVIWNLETEG